MKNITLILISIIGLTIACKPQQPIAKITSENIRTSGVLYHINKPNNKYTQVINANNKFTNTKMIAPNLPFDLKIPGYRKFDKNIIFQICADIIPLSSLKKENINPMDYLFLSIKVNTKGEPMEIEFLANNSMPITSVDIQKIEEKILKSSFKVTFNKEIERYLVGANFLNVDVIIRYGDMLKAKENNQLN